MFDSMIKTVTVRDMGPREGLQSESTIVSMEDKIALIMALRDAGVKHVQVTSFVNPKVVKQFADAEALLEELDHPDDVFYWATVPNMRGLERAAKTHINGISVPISVTDGHNIVNMQRTTARALSDAKKLIAEAKAVNLHVNASISVVYGCPIEGYVPPEKVIDMCKRLQWMGVDALSFGDTTGMANPRQVKQLLSRVMAEFPGMEIITHFHDVRGAGLANVLAAMDAGVSIHDCALCGMGGQPSTKRNLYAYGRLGNICTEDLVSMLEESGVRTGINLFKLIDAARLFEKILGRELPGFVSKAGPVKALWGGGTEYLDYFIETFGYKDVEDAQKTT